jgi:hypothetical protein
MRRQIYALLVLLTLSSYSFGQNKTLIGIVPFKSSSSGNDYYSRDNNSSEYKTAIQDAVSDAFLKTKRFSLVEREKMEQLKSEKNLQKEEDFIDGTVIEQSKSLGAQFVVLGNVIKAKVEEKTTNMVYVSTTTKIAEVSFNIRIVDVTTGEIVASNSFNKTAKGKNPFDEALNDIKPEIEKFIKDNFKITASIVSVEEKNSNGDATKVLISGGSSTGVMEKNEFKIFEVSELVVDGKKLTRKKTIGKLIVTKVEDENFSICTITEGGAEIAKKIEAGAKIKCELINE